MVVVAEEDHVNHGRTTLGVDRPANVDIAANPISILFLILFGYQLFNIENRLAENGISLWGYFAVRLLSSACLIS